MILEPKKNSNHQVFRFCLYLINLSPLSSEKILNNLPLQLSDAPDFSSCFPSNNKPFGILSSLACLLELHEGLNAHGGLQCLIKFLTALYFCLDVI